jgi:hypothetical protein
MRRPRPQNRGNDIMAKGMDPMSRREFMARRLGDMGIIALVVAAGPVFGRMLNSLYVQESGRLGTQKESPPRAEHLERAQRTVDTAKTADL